MPVIAPTESSLRRRLVYRGLQGFVPAEMLKTAVELCDREFQGDATFNVMKYLNRFVQFVPNLQNDLLKCHSAITRLRSRSAEDLGPDPIHLHAWDVSTPRPGAAKSARPENPCWSSTFNEVLNHMFIGLELLSIDSSNRALDYLRVKPLGVSERTQDDLRTLVNVRRAQFSEGTTFKEMQSILHHLYLGLCEEFGPVVADRIVQRTMREVEKLPTAVQFPPTRLL